jgi:hypothetical protein
VIVPIVLFPFATPLMVHVTVAFGTSVTTAVTCTEAPAVTDADCGTTTTPGTGGGALSALPPPVAQPDAKPRIKTATSGSGKRCTMSPCRENPIGRLIPSTPRPSESCGALNIYFALPFGCFNTLQSTARRNSSSTRPETQSKPHFSVSTSYRAECAPDP